MQFSVFLILLVAGLFLVGAEIFMPGGVMGTLGGLALLAAAITSFLVFGPGGGTLVSLLIIILVGAAFLLWIKIFPNTALGKKMTVHDDLAKAKGTQEGLDSYLDKTGVALSDLRPSGYATIEGKRLDVVTEGQMISKDEKIKVVEVEGNRVVVRRIE